MEGNLLLPFDLQTDEGQAFCRDLLIPPGHDEEANGGHPGDALLAHAEQLGAKLVILELGYIDQDYRDEFATFYAGCFADISSLCDRLLFFSDDYVEDITPETVSSLSGFLGYVVLRPLTHARIGRCVMSGPKGENLSLTCLHPSRVHLLGRQFQVSGVPFMQQTTEVTSCAQIAVWSVGRYMGVRHGLDRFSPAEVNDLATREYHLQRTMPTDGLAPESMSEALSAMGLGPLVYSPRAPRPGGDDEESILADHRDVVVRSLASAVPPVIVTEADEQGPYHAVSAVGVTWAEEARLPAPLTSVGCLAASFVVNDDARGPYSSLAFGGGLRVRELERVILPFPKKVYLKLEDAEEQVTALLSRRADPDHSALYATEAGQRFMSLLDDGRVLLNTYAIRSVEYKQRLLERVGSDKDWVRHYLYMSLPKWLVVSEFVILQEASAGEDPEATRTGVPAGILGEVVMDSTAHVHTPPFLAVHLPGLMVVHRSEPTDDSRGPEGQLVPATNRRWHVVDDDAHPLEATEMYRSCSWFGFGDE